MRGGSKRLASESANGQNNSFYIDSFESNGFWVDGISNVLDPMLGAGNTHVAWSFRRAPKFFDVVTWTGNGGTNRQIAHALGVAPGMIVIKATSTTSNWSTYHRSLSSTQHTIDLNLTGGQTNQGVNVWTITDTYFVAVS